MQVGQFASFTPSVAGADVVVAAAVVAAAVAAAVVAALDGVGVLATGAGGDGTEEVTGAADGAVARPGVAGTADRVDGAVSLGRGGLLRTDATSDDNGPSCGTVTSTVAPAGAATDNAGGKEPTAAEDVAPDAEVATVHPARLTPKSPATTVRSAASRDDRRAGSADMPSFLHDALR